MGESGLHYDLTPAWIDFHACSIGNAGRRVQGHREHLAYVENGVPRVVAVVLDPQSRGSAGLRRRELVVVGRARVHRQAVAAVLADRVKEDVGGLARGRVFRADGERGNIVCAHRIAFVGLEVGLHGREIGCGARMKREDSSAMRAESFVVRVQNNVAIEQGIVVLFCVTQRRLITVKLRT